MLKEELIENEEFIDNLAIKAEKIVERVEKGEISLRKFSKDLILRNLDMFWPILTDSELRDKFLRVLLLAPILSIEKNTVKGIAIYIFGKYRYLDPLSIAPTFKTKAFSDMVKNLVNFSLPIGARVLYALYKMIPSKFVTYTIASKLTKKLIKWIIRNFYERVIKDLSKPISEKKIKRDKIPTVRISSDLLPLYFGGLQKKKGPFLDMQGLVPFAVHMASTKKLSVKNISVYQVANWNMSDRFIDLMSEIVSDMMQVMNKKRLINYIENHLPPIMDKLFDEYTK